MAKEYVEIIGEIHFVGRPDKKMKDKDRYKIEEEGPDYIKVKVKDEDFFFMKSEEGELFIYVD